MCNCQICSTKEYKELYYELDIKISTHHRNHYFRAAYLNLDEMYETHKDSWELLLYYYLITT